MRKSFVPAVAMTALSVAMFIVTGAACSQVPPTATAPAAAAAPAATAAPAAEAPAALSPEDRNAAPIPPGRYAATVKRVCTECHNANMFLSLRFNKDEATRYYRNMVSSDTSTDDAKKIIEYLSTTLGR